MSKAIAERTLALDLSEPLVPEQSQGIQMTYWTYLKAVPDPQSSDHVVYPLYWILHGIVAGLLGGARSMGKLSANWRTFPGVLYACQAYLPTESSRL